jgi:RNA polymerase sigma-70 factor (ECF subfamily)
VSAVEISLEERRWLLALRDGDSRAFEHIFRAYYDKLCSFAIRYVRTREQAEDVVHDILFALWRERESYEIRGTLRAYLYTAVRNRALDHLKREGVELRWREEAELTLEAFPASGAPGADEELVAAELSAIVREAIDALPPRYRQAYVLRRQHGLSYAEIAGIMNITVKTVEVQIGQALKRIRERVRTWGSDGGSETA